MAGSVTAAGKELWDEIYGSFGLKGFHAGSTSVQMAGWFNKEIKSAADFKGLKMRIPGLGGEALRKLGATIVNLPVGEIFGALQSGAIDATEWVGPWQDLAAGFYKVAKYYYWPGMHEPATLNEISVNKAKFDALPKDIQQIFAWACGDEHVQLTAESDASNAGALDVLIKQHNVQLKKLPDDFVQAYGGAWNEVLTELRDGGDALTKKILEFLLQVPARADGLEPDRPAGIPQRAARRVPASPEAPGGRGLRVHRAGGPSACTVERTGSLSPAGAPVARLIAGNLASIGEAAAAPARPAPSGCRRALIRDDPLPAGRARRADGRAGKPACGSQVASAGTTQRIARAASCKATNGTMPR